MSLPPEQHTYNILAGGPSIAQHVADWLVLPSWRFVRSSEELYQCEHPRDRIIVEASFELLPQKYPSSWSPYEVHVVRVMRMQLWYWERKHPGSIRRIDLAEIDEEGGG